MIETGSSSPPPITEEWGSQRPRKAEEDVVGYLSSVKGSLESGIDGDERAALVRNVLEEIHQSEASLASHKRCSFVLESLLTLTESPGALVMFLKHLQPYYGWLVYNRFSSHVVESLFSRIAFVLGDEGSYESVEGEEDEVEKLVGLVEGLAQQLVKSEEWWSMMSDPCATHSLRALFCVLNGSDPAAVLKSKKNGRSRRFGFVVRREEERSNEGRVSRYSIQKLRNCLNDMLNAANQWNTADLVRAGCDTYSGPVVQLLLRFTSKESPEEWQKLVDKFMHGGLCISGQGSAEAGTDEEKLHSFKLLCCHPVSSHLMEVVMTHCRPKHFRSSIFPTFLKGNLLELSRHKMANYVIQAAIQAVSTDAQLGVVLEELTPGIADSLLNNNLGVIWRLAEKCGGSTVKEHQRSFISSLVQGLRQRRKSGDRYAGKGVIDCLLDITQRPSSHPDATETEAEAEANAKAETTTGEDGSPNRSERSRLSPLGALITEAVLGFRIDQCRVLLESLASMQPEDLATVCADPIGGRRVIEPLMRAEPSFRWAQHRVLSKLLPKLVPLCENRYSANSIKLAFAAGSYADRTMIVKKLNGARTRLAGSKCGTSVLTHCKVQLFREQPSQWQELQRREKKKRKRESMDGFLQGLESSNDQRKTKKRKEKQKPKQKKEKEKGQLAKRSITSKIKDEEAGKEFEMHVVSPKMVEEKKIAKVEQVSPVKTRKKKKAKKLGGKNIERSLSARESKKQKKTVKTAMQVDS